MSDDMFVDIKESKVECTNSSTMHLGIAITNPFLNPGIEECVIPRSGWDYSLAEIYLCTWWKMSFFHSRATTLVHLASENVIETKVKLNTSISHKRQIFHNLLIVYSRGKKMESRSQWCGQFSSMEWRDGL